MACRDARYNIASDARPHVVCIRIRKYNLCGIQKLYCNMETRATKPRDAILCPLPVVEFLTGGNTSETVRAAWGDCGTLANGKVEIRRSRVAQVTDRDTPGRGLFANADFTTGDTITVYGGQPIDLDVATRHKSTVAHRFMLRISDSDFVVDGSQYANGITRTPSPGGRFHPTSTDAPQLHQGAGAVANHAIGFAANASVDFVALSRSNACMTFPRIPTLRAKRNINVGDEILYDYGITHIGM